MRRGLLAAACVLLLAAPASAAGGITSPGDGSVVTDGVVPVRAVVDPDVRPSQLLLQPPGTAEPLVVDRTADPEDTELAYDLDAGCAPPACTVAPNGEWTALLVGAAEDTRTFALRLPPAAPTSVAVVRTGDGVELSWALGGEPDLTGYSVDDAGGTAVLPDVPLSACSDGACRVTVPEADGWTVRASRSVCPDCRETVVSAASPVVRLEALPSAAPAAPRAATVPAPRPAQGFTVPQRQAVRVPQLGAAAEEPVETRLEYGSPVAEPARAAGDLLSGDRYRVLAVGALLVGVAVWLRRWARRAALED